MPRKAACPLLVCPVHDKPAIHVYPCCVGMAGGARKSKAKARASARNGRKGGRPRGNTHPPP